jgi:hypothetical protein
MIKVEYPPAVPARALAIIEVNGDQVEDIFFFYPADRIGDVPIVRLSPEVKEWCIENLHGNMAYPRVITEYDAGKDVLRFRFFIDFMRERDAILFKLRWVG